MQRLRRISRPAPRHLYCLLLQLLVILAAAVAAAAGISETGVSGAAGQLVSGGNAAAARLFAQRLTSISSPLSRARNIKGAAKTSAIISGRGGDTKLAREKAKELNLPDYWDVLVGDGRGSLLGGKEVAGVLVKFLMKEYLRIVPRDKQRGFMNAVARIIMNGRLRGMLEKYFVSKIVRKVKVYTAMVPDAIYQNLLIYIVEKDVKDNENLLDDHILKDGLGSGKKEMFSSIRRKRFLHEVNTDERSRFLKDSRETSSVNNQIRQKRHSWHFMGENFWATTPQSHLVYTGVPTIMVQWPQIPSGFSPHETQYDCKTFEYRNAPLYRQPDFAEWLYPGDADDWYTESDDNNDGKVPKYDDDDSDIIEDNDSSKKESADEDRDIIKDNDSSKKDSAAEDSDIKDNDSSKKESAAEDSDIKNNNSSKKESATEDSDIKDNNSSKNNSVAENSDIKDNNNSKKESVAEDSGIKDNNSSKKDSVGEGRDTRKDPISSDQKFAAERLKTGGLSQMLQYNKNTYKKNRPLDHLKSHQNPPWPQKNIVGIPSVNKRKPRRRTKRPKNKPTNKIFK